MSSISLAHTTQACDFRSYINPKDKYLATEASYPVQFFLTVTTEDSFFSTATHRIPRLLFPLICRISTWILLQWIMNSLVASID